MDERGNVGHDTIKFLLGHSERENLKFYLRRDQHKINQLTHEMALIEEELESSLKEKNKNSNRKGNIEIKEEGREDESSLSIDEETLITLLETHPKLAIQLIQKGIGNVN